MALTNVVEAVTAGTAVADADAVTVVELLHAVDLVGTFVAAAEQAEGLLARRLLEHRVGARGGDVDAALALARDVVGRRGECAQERVRVGACGCRERYGCDKGQIDKEKQPSRTHLPC